MNQIVERSLSASTENSSLIAQVLSLDTDFKLTTKAGKKAKEKKKEKQAKVKAPPQEALF